MRMREWAGTEEDESVRSACLREVPEIGEALVAALKDEWYGCARAAAESIKMLRYPMAATALVAALEDSGLRDVASEALGEIGEHAVGPLKAHLMTTRNIETFKEAA